MPAVTPTPIPALPPAPQPTDDRVGFSSKAFSFAAALESHRVAHNTAAAQTYQNALEAKTQADRAGSEANRAGTEADQAELARARAEDALASAEAIAVTTFWVSGTAYAKGAVVWSLAQPGTRYVRLTAGSGATDPYSDTTNWARVGANEQLQAVNMTANTTAAAGIIYTMTSSGIRLTLPVSPAPNDRVGFVNASSGDCLVNFNGKTVKGTAVAPADMVIPQFGAAQIIWSAPSNTWVEV